MSITLTPQQVGKILNMSAPTVRKLAAAGKIPGAVNTGTKGTRAYWHFDERALKTWVREQKNGHRELMKTLKINPEPSDLDKTVDAYVELTSRPMGTGITTLMLDIVKQLTRLEEKIDLLSKMWS